MIISDDELFGLFETCYDKEIEAGDLASQAREIKKDIPKDLKTFAEANEVDVKVVKASYAYYKSLRERKIPIEDDAYFTLASKIEEHIQSKEKGE